jgi:AraC-like DNA-binding protein
MSVFNIAGIAVSAFFVTFILSKKSHTWADLWLIVINLIMIGFLGLVMLANQKFTTTIFFLQAQLPFYLFPTYLLFALEKLQKKRRWTWLLLFTSAVAGSICIAADLYFFHDYNSPALLHQVYNDPPFYYHIIYKGNQVFFVAALVMLIKQLKLYKSEINNNFSFTDPIDLHWLTNSSWMYLILTLTSLITFLLSNFKILPTDAQASFAIVSVCMALVIFYLSFQGIRQYSISEYYGKQSAGLLEERSTPRISTVDSPDKYKSSSLTKSEEQIIYDDLLRLFESDSVYRESKLQLLDVAEMLKVSHHSLSQTINTLAGKPFSDFVNSYRVKYLQKLLEDPNQKRFTILALGLESGFNSKASLNRVFKEQTGFSPSEYQKLHLQK